MNAKPLGIFDSGVGGLTVVKQIMSLLPFEKIVYLGDTARVPYGTKSTKTVRAFAVQDTEFLLQFSPKLIIIACHTVSSLAADFLKDFFPQCVFLDVVVPSVEQALKITRNKKIGVIGTPATIRSGIYRRLLQTKDEKVEVFCKECALFVPLVEEGWGDHKISYDIAEVYLKDLKKSGIDTLILGCTHYPLLSNVLKQTMGKEIQLVDSSNQVASKAKVFLAQQGFFSQSVSGKADLYFTDCNIYAKRMVEKLIGARDITINEVENVQANG